MKDHTIRLMMFLVLMILSTASPLPSPITKTWHRFFSVNVHHVITMAVLATTHSPTTHKPQPTQA
ncbi:MAG: hypothetical protein RL090_848 [Bacteroidota bacterium]